MGTGAPHDFIQSFRYGHRGAIGTVGGYGVKGISHGQNPGAQWYLFPGDHLFHAITVIIVMVMLNHLHYSLINHWFYNTSPDMGVNHNVLILLRGQFSRLILNNLVNSNLTHVVEQTSPAQVFYILRG